MLAGGPDACVRVCVRVIFRDAVWHCAFSECRVRAGTSCACGACVRACVRACAWVCVGECVRACVCACMREGERARGPAQRGACMPPGTAEPSAVGHVGGCDMCGRAGVGACCAVWVCVCACVGVWV